MKNLNKKGGQYDVLLTITIIVVLAVVFFGILRPTSSQASTFFSTQTLKVKESACALETQRAMEKGLVLDSNNDVDGDGLLDTCDTCVCREASGSCKNTVENDKDLDGMPKGCDKDDNDNAIIGCNFVPINGRCVESASTALKK